MSVRHPEPIVVVSQCLGFKNCRYNGQTVHDRFVEKLGEHVKYITVCPEEEIGLGTPRDPVRIGQTDNGIRMVQPATGKDYTGEMSGFAESFLGSIEHADGFIMKNRSPSSRSITTSTNRPVRRGARVCSEADWPNISPARL